MIIVHMCGGLGNQMFQYAAGKALSVCRNELLSFDVSDYAEHGYHNGFELSQVFSFPVTLASATDVCGLLGWQSSKRIREKIICPSWRFLRSRHLIVEPHFHYWPDIIDVTMPCYMIGYWQSERYFTNIKQIIRSNFTFHQPLSEDNNQLVQQIMSVNSVSVHIRRGDYVHSSVHGLCPISYYETATEYIAKRVERPYFFVFSDDIDWARKNLKITGECHHIIHNRGQESYNDMHLMSICKHHIIANSSFSWWGAWLNPSKTKIVIAPKRWFNNYPVYTGDIYSEGWIKL